MFKIKIILFAMVLLLSIQLATAFETLNTCDDNSTLRKAIVITKCANGNCTTHNLTQVKICNYGCDNVTKSCSPNPFELNLQIIYAIVGGLLAIGLIALLFRRIKW